MIRKATLLTLIVLCCGLGLDAQSTVRAQSASPAGVIVLEAQGSQAIQLFTYDAMFRFDLTLQESAIAPGGSDVELHVGELERADGQIDHQAQVKVGLALGAENGHFPSPGEQLAPLITSFHLEPGELATLQLSGNLSNAGGYRTWFEVKTAQGQNLYTLQITRASPPDLLILGAQGGMLALSSSGEDFQSRLYLQLPAGQPGLDSLVLGLQAIQRADGQPAAGASLSCDVCDGKPHVLNPAQLFPIALRGKLGEPAVYQALLTLQTAGKQPLQVVLLQITRLAPAQHLALSVSTPLNAMRPLLGSAAVNLNVLVTENGSRGGALFLPAASGLALSAKNGQTGGYSGETQAVFLPGGAALDAGALIPLKPNASQMMKLRLDGLNQAGTYTGSVSISGPDSARVSQPFELRVRDHWLWALLCIAAGVLLAFGVLLLTRQIHPRLVFAARAAHERQLLKEAGLPAGDPVAAFLERELGQLLARRGLSFSLPTQRLDDLSLRRQTYTHLYTLFQAACQSMSGAPQTASLDAALKAAQEELSGAESFDAAAAKALLAEFEKQVTAAETAALLEPAKDLQAALEDIIQAAPALAASAGVLAAGLSAAMKSASVDPRAFRAYLGDLQFQIADLRLSQWQNLMQAMQLERRRSLRPADPDWKAVDEKCASLSQTLLGLQSAILRRDLPAVVETSGLAASQQLDAAIAQLERLAGPLGCPTGFDEKDWQALLDARQPQLGEDLAQARQAQASSDLAQAARWFELAQSEYMLVLVRLLPQQIERILRQLKDTRPVQVPVGDWEAIEGAAVQKAAASLRQAGDQLPGPETPADQRQAAFQKARGSFVENWGLLVEATVRRVGAYLQKNLPARGDLAKELDQIQTTLEEARLCLASDPGLAEEKIGDAHNRLVALAAGLSIRISLEGLTTRTELEKAPSPEPMAIGMLPWGAGMALPRAISSLSLPAGLPEGFFLGRALEQRSEAEIQSLIGWSDLATGLIVLALAVVIGFNALYLPNPTFGGSDYAAAFLWGFGLQGSVGGLGGLLGALNLGIK